MKKLSWLFVLSLIMFACSTDEMAVDKNLEKIDIAFKMSNANARMIKDVCGNTLTTPLLAGQSIPVGEVSAYNDRDSLYITVSIEGDYKSNWFIRQTHLYIGHVSVDFSTGVGKKKDIINPAPGKFPYAYDVPSENVLGIQEYTFRFPLGGLYNFGEFDIAVHTEVVRVTNIQYNENGVATSAYIAQKESAWGKGKEFSSKGNWAMYFPYLIKDCAKLCQDEWSRYLVGNGDTAYDTLIIDQNDVFDLSVDNKVIGEVDYIRTGVKRDVGTGKDKVTYWDYTVTLVFSISQPDFTFIKYSAFTTADINNPNAKVDEMIVEDSPSGGVITLHYTIQSNGNIPKYYVGLYSKIEGECK